MNVDDDVETLAVLRVVDSVEQLTHIVGRVALSARLDQAWLVHKRRYFDSPVQLVNVDCVGLQSDAPSCVPFEHFVVVEFS